PASLSDLIAKGVDEYDFRTLSDEIGTTRYVGQDTLTGRQVVIDGITLDETTYDITAYDAEGEEIWRSKGNEFINRNWRVWNQDYEAPFTPTPSPPDPSLPNNAVRLSTLPMDQIATDVIDAGLGLNAYVDQFGGGGRFLSEYIAYHGVWYQDMHKDPTDPYQSVAAGHIHVGQQVSIAQGRAATEVSLRTLIEHVDAILVPEPSGMVWMGMLLLVWLRGRHA
ncbi:MAG: hypothetical protein AAGF97_12390, partial [Planctomycetota bacterium]